jgi:RNA polymerase sigma-70 factor (ECF subfamily)
MIPSKRPRGSNSRQGRIPQRSSVTDEELVLKVQDNQPTFYEELVKRYENQLLRYAQYLIKDRDKAADVVQIAFIKAYKNLNSFDAKKKFSSWLYRIVHNEAVNIIRKESKQFSLDALSFADKFLARFDNPEESMQDKEIKKLLKTSLDELPIAYRAPLVLYYLEDKSYDEIGEVLQMPIGTVGTRINRGKKQLKELVQRKGGEVYVR